MGSQLHSMESNKTRVAGCTGLSPGRGGGESGQLRLSKGLQTCLGKRTPYMVKYDPPPS